MGPPPAPPPCPPATKESPLPSKSGASSWLGGTPHVSGGPVEEVRFAARMLRGYLTHKSDDFNDDTVFVCHYNWIPSRIQEGPMCGLVALEIASKLFNKNISIQDIVSLAQKKGVTKLGEMFSAAHMADLAETLYGCRTMVLQYGLGDQKMILDHVMNGGAILLPYDIDHDFHPCCKNGKKAHWAIITGFLLSSPKSSIDGSSLKPDEQETYLYHGTPEIMQGILRQASDCDIYICGKHGKSRHLGLWNYSKMRTSNENLHELNPDIANSLSKWVVPVEGGHLSGLRGKAVLLFTSDK
ncbi:actin maturation protease-like [Lineus longissimus]|uniref:actin maturation protease-like n=1 Tax=Lineus longissimus TaxID=88925 RepID=UPI00315C8495